MTAILELGTHFYFSNSQLDIVHIYGRKIKKKKKKSFKFIYTRGLQISIETVIRYIIFIRKSNFGYILLTRIVILLVMSCIYLFYFYGSCKNIVILNFILKIDVKKKYLFFPFL